MGDIYTSFGNIYIEVILGVRVIERVGCPRSIMYFATFRRSIIAVASDEHRELVKSLIFGRSVIYNAEVRFSCCKFNFIYYIILVMDKCICRPYSEAYILMGGIR